MEVEQPNSTSTTELNTQRGIQVSNMTLSSRYLALVMFVILPFVGGYIGYTLATEKVIEIDRVAYSSDEVWNEVESNKLITDSTTPEESGTKGCEEQFIFCDNVVYLAADDTLVVSSHDQPVTGMPIMGIPAHTEIFDVFSNEQEIIFITRTDIKFGNTSRSGYTPQFVAVHQYDRVAKQTDGLFTSNDTDQTYIRFPKSFDPNERIWPFSVYSCWNCDGGDPQTFLFDSEVTRNSKTIGRIVELELLSDTEYRYKVYDPSEDDEHVVCEMGCEYLSTAHLPWVYGTIDSLK